MTMKIVGAGNYILERRSSAAIMAMILLMTQAEFAWSRSVADQALYEKAVKACNGPEYPNGARPHINYGAGWFRCVPPKASRR